jgi:hypothetical protein
LKLPDVLFRDYVSVQVEHPKPLVTSSVFRALVMLNGAAGVLCMGDEIWRARGHAVMHNPDSAQEPYSSQWAIARNDPG